MLKTNKKIDYIDFAYSIYADEYNKYGKEEILAAKNTLKSGRLFFPIGHEVFDLEKKITDDFKSSGCSLVTSGTAAIHTALGACNIGFGDEVITTPISDTGTVLPIFLQGAIPVFADVNPRTMMISRETIESVITKKTKAIIIVHYGGFPADMDPILELARNRKILIIEDCAQAPLTFYKGRRAGVIGDCGAFSTNDTKHVSCGDGGFVVSKNKNISKKAMLFHDKGFDRKSKIRNPIMVGPNYRMTEIQAAILNKQWDKLRFRVEKRQKFATMINKVIENIPHLHSLKISQNDSSSYFAYPFLVDKNKQYTRDKLCDELCEAGLPARKGNLYDVLYKLNIFNKALPKYMKNFQHQNYRKGLCPQAEIVNKNMVRLEMLEIFGEKEVRIFKQVVC
ncbi:MAG: DegT/DnrJ/EryC1/StrS family aminotransferase [Candidatus Paceibacterota bacterium]